MNRYGRFYLLENISENTFTKFTFPILFGDWNLAAKNDRNFVGESINNLPPDFLICSRPNSLVLS
jgi:hypothetical protein